MTEHDEGYIKGLLDIIALLKIDLAAAREAEVDRSSPWIAATIAQAERLIAKRKEASHVP